MPYLRVCPGTPGFPQRLEAIPSPPVCLWVRGDPGRLPSPSTRSIAIVGSRAASRDGLDAARAMADGLVRAGVVVVSGLARGIDGAAHQAALEAGGCTVAVLGSGLDRVYPAEHGALADAIAASGAVISEYPPPTAPRAGLFPRRNRLIAGLADAVVIIEAGETSGALITSSAALEQGKDVMVVPGRVAGGRNRGGHLLLRDGAALVERAADVLAERGWTAGPPGPEPVAADAVEFTVDELAAATGEPTPVVLARLLQLELAGEIQRLGSGRFLRVRGRMLT